MAFFVANVICIPTRPSLSRRPARPIGSQVAKPTNLAPKIMSGNHIYLIPFNFPTFLREYSENELNSLPAIPKPNEIQQPRPYSSFPEPN